VVLQFAYVSLTDELVSCLNRSAMKRQLAKSLSLFTATILVKKYPFVLCVSRKIGVFDLGMFSSLIQGGLYQSVITQQSVTNFEQKIIISILPMNVLVKMGYQSGG
ncbi:hypothetical protein ACJX0J_019212, partial [Zea mays]